MLHSHDGQFSIRMIGLRPDREQPVCLWVRLFGYGPSAFPDEPSYMAGILGCDVRVWKRLRRQLIDKQKTDASGGHIAELGAT